MDRRHLHQAVIGDRRPRHALIGSVIGVLVVASGAFVLGLDAGFSLWWILGALGIAVVAGVAGAGLGPTVGALWLIALWWFAFPPLVGYLSGDWTMASRYTHPRMAGFGYTSARAELMGGLEYGVELGLFFAVVPGTIAYVSGTVVDWIATQIRTQ